MTKSLSQAQQYIQQQMENLNELQEQNNVLEQDKKTILEQMAEHQISVTASQKLNDSMEIKNEKKMSGTVGPNSGTVFGKNRNLISNPKASQESFFS